MTKKVQALAWIMLSFMCLFMMIGYAAIVDRLDVTGTAEVQVKPFEGVYIFSAGVYSENGAEDVSLEYVNPTNLLSTATPSRTGGSITYEITVHNNTNVTYWYLRQDYDKDFESNALIGNGHGVTVVTKDHPNDTVDTFNNEDWIPSQTYRVFYVTYTFGSSAQEPVTTFINFLFGVKMDSIHDQFLNVLNDTAENGKYQHLTDAFNEKFAESGATTISSTGDDAAIFDELFGKNITVNVDGKDLPATVVIRRENVDGKNTGDSYSGTAGAPTGCEYTLYITVDALNSTTGEAMVYAVSYSNGGHAVTAGSWYQVGQLYEGTANIIDTDPEAEGVQGMFDVSTWQATPQRYEVADGITYLVGQEQGDQYDKLNTLEQLMSTNDQDIFNDIDNTGILKDVYNIVYNSQNTSKAGYKNLHDAFVNASPFYNVMNGGQEVKVKRDATRAEIIPYILAIQNALDYYNQVNG